MNFDDSLRVVLYTHNVKLCQLVEADLTQHYKQTQKETVSAYDK